MRDGWSRRRFLGRVAAAGGGALLGSGAIAWMRDGRAIAETAPDLAVARGGSPAANCRAAVEALGGFGRFVREGDRVVLKPNPVGTFAPERAIHTHPEVLECVIEGCREAGAAEVLVVSHDDPAWLAANGTQAAAERAGAQVRTIQERSEYREVLVPRGRILKRVEIASDLLDADVFINLPIAKHHAGTRLTLSLKNLMGVNWDRQIFHRTHLHQCIAELASAVPHTLVVMDAHRVLQTNGPIGPGRVREFRQVVAGVDPVAVDAFATSYFNLSPDRIEHIRIAHALGVGEIDIGRLRIRTIDL